MVTNVLAFTFQSGHTRGTDRKCGQSGRGWIGTADDAALAQARQLLGFDKPEDGPAAFVRAVLASRADTAMIPMQDVLGLGGWARMNRPGTIGNNWLWRMAPGAATPELAQRLRRENEATNRRMD